MKDIPILNIYLLLCYAWDHVQERDAKAVTEAERLRSMQDLLGKVLATGADRLLRRGIDRGYMPRREDLAGVRGKLAMGETVKRSLRARSRIACEFEELSPDILPNRILRSSLDSLRKLGVAGKKRSTGASRADSSDPGLDSKVHEEVTKVYHRLEGVSVQPLSHRTFSLVQIDRNRRLYQFLLHVCRLVYDCRLVDGGKSGRAASKRFSDFRRDEARMWKLFEDFVTGFYRKEQRRFKVNPDGRAIKWKPSPEGREADRARIPKMEADLILESGDRRIVLDTKFYGDALAGRGTAGKLRSGNLYQLLAYLRNREAGSPDQSRPHEGILLYPQVDERLRVDIRLEGFRIQACTVNLNADWREIHKEMLEIVGVEREP